MNEGMNRSCGCGEEKPKPTEKESEELQIVPQAPEVKRGPLDILQVDVDGFLKQQEEKDDARKETPKPWLDS